MLTVCVRFVIFLRPLIYYNLLKLLIFMYFTGLIKTHMNLDKLRGKIDALDSEIIDLFNKRANVVKEIGAIKNRKNAQIYAADREKQVFERVSAKTIRDL